MKSTLRRCAKIWAILFVFIATQQTAIAKSKHHRGPASIEAPATTKTKSTAVNWNNFEAEVLFPGYEKTIHFESRNGLVTNDVCAKEKRGNECFAYQAINETELQLRFPAGFTDLAANTCLAVKGKYRPANVAKNQYAGICEFVDGSMASVVSLYKIRIEKNGGK